MTSNAHVALAWSNSSDAHAEHLRTDGIELFSYDLRIGTTVQSADEDDRKVVFDYTAKGGHFYSATTSRHVGQAKQYADAVVNPDYDVLYDVRAHDGRAWGLVSPDDLPAVLAEIHDTSGQQPEIREVSLEQGNYFLRSAFEKMADEAKVKQDNCEHRWRLPTLGIRVTRATLQKAGYRGAGWKVVCKHCAKQSDDMDDYDEAHRHDSAGTGEETKR